MEIFLGFLEMAVTAQNLWADCVLNFRIYALNLVLDVNKCREWVVDRSQNMGPSYGKFFGHLGLSVNAQELIWAVMLEFIH